MGRVSWTTSLATCIMIALATTDHVGCIRLLEVHSGGTTWAQANDVCTQIGGRLLESGYLLISKLAKITDIFVSDTIWTPYFTVTGVSGIIDSQSCSVATVILPDVTYTVGDTNPQQCLMANLNNGLLETASSCQQNAAFVCESDCIVQVKTFDYVYIAPYMVEVLSDNTAAEFECTRLCLSDSICKTFVFTVNTCHFFDVDVETDTRDDGVELVSQERSGLGKKICTTDISLTTSSSKRWNGPVVQHETDNVDLDDCMDLCAWLNTGCTCADYSTSLRTCVLELSCSAQSTASLVVTVKKLSTIPALVVVGDPAQYPGTAAALSELCPQYFTTSSLAPSTTTGSMTSAIATVHYTPSSDIVVSHAATVDSADANDTQSDTVPIDSALASGVLESTKLPVSSLTLIPIQRTAENDNGSLANTITITEITQSSIFPSSISTDIAYSTIPNDDASLLAGSDIMSNDLGTSIPTPLSDISRQLPTTTVKTVLAEDYVDTFNERTTMHVSSDVLAAMPMLNIEHEQNILQISPMSVSTARLIDVKERCTYECKQLSQINSSPHVTPFQCVSVARDNVLLTPQQKDQFMEDIMEDLAMDKSETGRARRKFISVSDDRPSATTMGSIGVLLLSLVFGGIILLDLSTLKRDLLILYQNLRGLREDYAHWKQNHLH